uniref:NADH dehydrogenase [ubiquinone] 1 alpha subcomplex subunit 5 n=1 Tax=Ditylenchus dipsaci TaxID=166011 RepID=A0A915DBN0_9BILA
MCHRSEWRRSGEGVSGVGKSTLCNRLVRPHFVDFHLVHLSYLSQADYSCSRVINNDHWLYWGETVLDSTDYSAAKTTHVRVVEQTVFLDDESFEPLGNHHHSSKLDDGGASYVKRALKTTLESSDKLMYICRDQLGQESDFVCHSLKDGKTGVDVFCVAKKIRLALMSNLTLASIFRGVNRTSNLCISSYRSLYDNPFVTKFKKDEAKVSKDFYKQTTGLTECSLMKVHITVFELPMTRLELVNQEPDVLKLEEKIGMGQLEEVVEQAHYEYQAAQVLLQHKVWEPLAEKPAEEQWRWPIH